ncbi:uncharacterized protein EV154DRAFT_510572 [Mucor mucedo]|uniref:uncharacterized protein n=1 Tax=Mucor mucedo TaxID=29922 RepID=UPI00221FBFFF|nr:uncharacterized protein EV154DRAFT_510572 [Mucor mucedo]KAI7890661.1 hypothetical protein EV154DRAFT_510572 [Mucor mucedo]
MLACLRILLVIHPILIYSLGLMTLLNVPRSLNNIMLAVIVFGRVVMKIFQACHCRLNIDTLQWYFR